MNADEYIGSNNDLNSQNLFLYVSNNYINRKDENGKYSEGLGTIFDPDYLKNTAETIGALGTAGMAALSPVIPYVGAILGGIIIGYGFAYLATSLSSIETNTKDREETLSHYNRAYVNKNTNKLVSCQQKLSYIEATAEGTTMSKNLLREVIAQDCGISQSEIKAIGYYTKDPDSAKALAISLSPVHGFVPHTNSLRESIFYEHNHPMKKQGKPDSIHVWYGDAVYR